MPEFSELALRITERELRALRIEQPEQIAAAVLARIETEIGGQSWYIPSGCRHRRDAIRRALSNGESVSSVARAFDVHPRTVRRIAGGS
jgi:Mor family transcriptional regulator